MEEIVKQQVDNYSVEIKLNDKSIDHISRKQRFVFRCLSMFGPKNEKEYSVKSKRELMQKWVNDLFISEGYNADIIFDESVWLPVDETSIGNRVLLITKFGRSIESQISEIDFRTENHHLFNVKYTWSEDK